ncbi:PAS domain S-box protein [Candidatus Peregrinibacteria bacterium]|nr:PAS domain S-box protein [Candidatus Peregrinibacteria bacterium]
MTPETILRIHKNIQPFLTHVEPRIQDEIVHSVKIAESLNEGLWVGDANQNTVYVNPLFEKLSGYSLSEIVGKSIEGCFSREDKKTVLAQNHLREIGVSSQYEATLITKTNKKIPILVSAATTSNGGSIAILTNLTKFKKLKSRDKIAEQIIRHSTEAMVVLDKKRRIKMWNNGASRLFGYKEKEILNNKIDIIIPESESEENFRIRQEVETKGVIKNYEGRRINKNKEIIDVSISISRVTDEKSNFKGYLIFYRDITQQKKFDLELQKRFEAIQDAYKELGLQKRESDYLYEITDSAVSPTGLQELSQLIVAAACMLTKCDAAVLRIFEEKSKTLRLKALIGLNGEWHNKNKIAYENSLAQDAFKLKRPLIIQDLNSNKKHQSINLVKKHHFTSLVLIPLIIGEKNIGTISLYATTSSKFRLIETDFLERFGKQCSLAIFTKSVL